MSESNERNRFIDYLNEIEITEETLEKRIINILNFYENLCPEHIQDIFVTDYITEELREYENLWFFSENYVMEAKKFISEDNFDLTHLRKINRLQIEKTHYDFVNSNEKSKLNFFCETKSLFIDMKASKENCNYLKDIITKYFIEKLKVD